jgi:hypothetical protein
VAHFLKPPHGRSAGYDVDNKLAPGSVWRMQIPVGERRTVALWGGDGLTIRSNNPSVVPNDNFAETADNDVRILSLFGGSTGTSLLEVGTGGAVWIILQVQVGAVGTPVNTAEPGEIISVGGMQLMVGGNRADFLRDLYAKGNDKILSDARAMLRSGKNEEEAARWVVETRNQLKITIREQGPVLFKKIVEYRNLKKYGNSVGPDYEYLTSNLSRQGVAAEKIDVAIIEGVTDTSAAFNSSGRRIKLIGTVGEVVGFMITATQESPANLPPLPKTQKEEIEAEHARLRYGIPASANIDRHGHLKKGSYLQIDMFDPHAGDEMASETEEILWFLGVSITYRYAGVTWTVPGR